MAKIMLISPKDYNYYNFRSEMILELHDLGFEVVLVCPYGKKIDFFTNKGCRFVELGIDRRGKNILNDFKLIMSYWNLMKRERPDIVLTYTTKPSVYGGYVCGKLKIPYIVNNAGLIDSAGLFDKFMKILYWCGFRKASCIMFQNSQERDIIEGTLCNKVHYRDIPGSGVNLEEFRYTDYPKDESVIIFNYVGRIVNLKGIDEYVECAKRIKKEYPNTEFRIYGDYDEDKYREDIDELQNKGIVKYCGVLLDMKPAIQTAHALIHPSHYEGMTNVVLEHSAMGRPCLGSDIPGIREGISDGQTGYLFEMKNIDSLVFVVKKFLSLTNEEKSILGRNARRKMEAEFSREIVTRTYIEEIYQCLGRTV